MLLLIKTCFFCILAIIVRGSIPRYRIDHLVTINWKILLYFLVLILFYFYATLFIFNIYYYY